MKSQSRSLYSNQTLPDIVDGEVTFKNFWENSGDQMQSTLLIFTKIFPFVKFTQRPLLSYYKVHKRPPQ